MSMFEHMIHSLLVIACVSSEIGCNKSEAAPSGNATASLSAGAQPVAVAVPRIDGEHYAVEIKPVGEAKAGQEASVEITIVVKSGYHINAQYPFKFKTAEPAPAGVTFPKPQLKREDGTFDENKGSFKLPFVASKSGKIKISGTLSMSVCSEANCLMDKHDLAVDVDVH